MKKYKKTIKQFFVMFLCMTMSISMLYQPTYALDTNVSYNNQTVHNTTAEDYEKDYVNIFDNQYDSYNEEDIDYEDESLREEYVKHFVMNDGTTQAVVLPYHKSK